MSARKIQIPPPKSIVSHLWGGPGQWHSLSYGRGLDQFFVDGLYDTPDDLMAAMDRRTAQGYGCWFSAHPMTERPPQPDDGRIARGGAEHVGSVVAIPADFDWKHDGAHKATDLPTEAEVRALLHKVPVQPADHHQLRSRHPMLVGARDPGGRRHRRRTLPTLD